MILIDLLGVVVDQLPDAGLDELDLGGDFVGNTGDVLNAALQ